MARLKTTVFVVDPDGRPRPFGPGDDLPDWATTQISNPDVWDGEAPDRPAETPDGSETPPRSGKGSGREAWAAYAGTLDVDVQDDASRDDIIDLLVERGLIEG